MGAPVAVAVAVVGPHPEVDTNLGGGSAGVLSCSVFAAGTVLPCLSTPTTLTTYLVAGVRLVMRTDVFVLLKVRGGQVGQPALRRVKMYWAVVLAGSPAAVAVPVVGPVPLAALRRSCSRTLAGVTSVRLLLP